MIKNQYNTTRNAWLIRLGYQADNRLFSVTVDHGSSIFQDVEEGDGEPIVGGNPSAAVSFARTYHISANLLKTTFFFDGVLPVNGGKTLTNLGATASDPKSRFCKRYANA